tara:strand:+ start:41 stop:238 length:198 start_codon:yes stop_codon:yes gene_type:complete
MKSKNLEKEEKLYKCESCKKKRVTFRLHECKKGYQEYFGCDICDNWCTKCKENWNNINVEKEQDL